MGYYTSYQLILPNPGNEDAKKYLRLVYLELRDKFNFLSKELDCEEKWHGHEEQLKDFSRLFPDTVFKLVGVGSNYWDIEEDEFVQDIWIKYFLNGEMYCDKLGFVVPDFDINRFKH